MTPNLYSQHITLPGDGTARLLFIHRGFNVVVESLFQPFLSELRPWVVIYRLVWSGVGTIKNRYV